VAPLLRADDPMLIQLTFLTTFFIYLSYIYIYNLSMGKVMSLWHGLAFVLSLQEKNAS